MKTYIAVTATLELSVSQKLIETITTLAKTLLEEKHVLVSLLGVSEKTELLLQFTNAVNEDIVKQAFTKMSSFGKADLSSLSLYFDLYNDKMEDGHCYIFCDRFQSIPAVLYSRLSFSFGVFPFPLSYPNYYIEPKWEIFSPPISSPLTLEEFVEQCCKSLRLVTNLIISIKDKYGFAASPFPRMPQKKLFEDPEFLFPSVIDSKEMMVVDCPTATMQFCSFLPETTLQNLQSRGCTYFLKPSKDNIDKQSYFNLSNHLITSHRIGLFRRSVGDYFLLRPYRQTPEAPTVYLMAEYILSTTIKFSKSATSDLALQKFRKHVFSYDGHTSFANQECMEMALSRIGRMIRRETDEAIVKRELMLATRHMAASCHPQLAYAITSILNDRINEVSPNLQRLFRNLLKVLALEGGLKKMVEYLEKEIPTSKTKSKLY
uniref:Uncharacterized protein n=1 Tax=Panagrolaimus sp. ES5 TaxID=591445 RepID=A0AC34FM59_9BILA